MRLKALSLSGYRQFLLQTDLEFPPGLVGLCGPNGVGKSKLIEAIGYALYGFSSHIFPKHDRVADLPSQAGAKGLEPQVRLVLELNGQEYEIERSTRHASIRVRSSQDPLAMTQTGVTRKVIELLRLPPAAYVGTFVARQKEVALLQGFGGTHRLRLVNRLIGITHVERAKDLAAQLCSERSQQLQAAQGAPGEPVTTARATLERLQGELAQAQILRTEKDAARDVANNDLMAATTMLGLLHNRVEAAAGIEREMFSLAGHIKTLETGRDEAHARAAAANEATRSATEARRILAETADVEERVHVQEALIRISELKREAAELGADLKDRILPGLEERDRLRGLLVANEGQAQKINQELGIHQASTNGWQEAARIASEVASRHERRRDTALSLGAAGACDTCGQVFGANLATALSHFAGEIEAARRDERDAREHALLEAETLEKTVWAAEHLHEEHERLRNGMLVLESLVGEQTATEASLDRIAQELASFSAGLSNLDYDPIEHERASADATRRAFATLDLSRAAPIEQMGPVAEVQFREAKEKLAQLELERQGLEEKLADTRPNAEELAIAEEAVSGARSNLERCQDAAQEEARRVGTLQGAVQAQEGAVARAIDRESRISQGQRTLHVTEKTQEALGQLLAAVNDEARPRLAELMDTWGDQLLGPTFGGVSLTRDYRIQADNGSGFHVIEHFSGGEQTVLAVMLRVAISLFCQERAGHEKGFLVLDEVFGDQDTNRRAELVAFLERIREHFHQILIVNHVEDVTNMLDSIVDVTSTGLKTSRAAFRV